MRWKQVIFGDLIILKSEYHTWYPLKMNCELRVLPGRAKSFSTPPVSFQCIKRFVGGARSSVVTMSVVSESCKRRETLEYLAKYQFS